jgi:hypothetical protein
LVFEAGIGVSADGQSWAGGGGTPLRIGVRDAANNVTFDSSIVGRWSAGDCDPRRPERRLGGPASGNTRSRYPDRVTTDATDRNFGPGVQRAEEGIYVRRAAAVTGAHEPVEITRCASSSTPCTSLDGQRRPAQTALSLR